jgi:hypothetical protein
VRPAARTRVVFLILDAFALKRADRKNSTAIWDWSDRGAGARVGRSVLASSTYPNHATFATGVGPARHGIFTNHVIRDGTVLPAFQVGPMAPTIFDSCQAAGMETEAILGDHHLVGVMGARAANRHWPPDGELDSQVQLDPLGYPHDDEVLPRLESALAGSADLVVGYFGSIDTHSHIFGPDSPEAAEAYRSLDGRLRQVNEALAPDWDRTILMVASDHDQVTALDRPPVDLRARAESAGAQAIVVDEGDAALVGTASPDWMSGCDGLAGWTTVGEGQYLAWSEPGRWFGATDGFPVKGLHGGEHTRDQLALISGGHPAVAAIAEQLGSVPEAAAWAGAIRAGLSI